MATAVVQEPVQTRITSLLGEIVALESHVEEAMDRQLKIKSDNVELTSGIQNFHDSVRSSKQRAIAFNETNGLPSTGNTIVKTATAVTNTLIGKATGLVDMVRHDSVAKSLRDDYVAYNLLAINYTMLHTTGMATEDAEATAFAEEGLRTYAGLVQQINHMIPVAVLEDLRASGEFDAPDNAIATECRKVIDKIWKSTSK